MTNACIDVCTELGFDYGVFNIIPFTDSIYFDNNDESGNYLKTIVYPHGSTKLLDLYHKGLLSANWKIFHNRDNFNALNILEILGDKFFNNDLVETNFNAIADTSYNKSFFIKPLTDEKHMNGLVLPKKTTLREYLSRNTSNDLTLLDGKELVIGSVKEPDLEARFFIVNGKLSTWSTYKYSGKLRPNIELTSREVNLCRKVIDLYHPAESFVVDLNISKRNDIITVMEYNCINCSGFYSVDKKKLFTDIKKGLDNG